MRGSSLSSLSRSLVSEPDVGMRPLRGTQGFMTSSLYEYCCTCASKSKELLDNEGAKWKETDGSHLSIDLEPSPSHPHARCSASDGTGVFYRRSLLRFCGALFSSNTQVHPDAFKRSGRSASPSRLACPSTAHPPSRLPVSHHRQAFRLAHALPSRTGAARSHTRR